MKVNVTELAPTERAFKITLNLTETELKMLQGVLHALDWEAQKDELNVFLEELYMQLSSTGVYEGASELGIVKKWSFL
jgi:hypothetical protein